VLASVTTRELSGYQEPKRSVRLIWAFLIAGVGVALIQLGGLKAVQTSTIVVALPMIPVLFILTWSLVRWLRQDFARKVLEPHLVLETPSPRDDAKPR
ncbi:BCCT family transporter, partial [Pseudoalteromonas sp. SIMBA_162]